MNDEAVIAVLGESVPLRSVERAFEHVAAAWRTSFVHRQLVRVARSAADPAAEYVRLAGWLAISASATRVALAGIDVIWGMPGSGSGWLGVAALATVCVLRPGAVVAACRGSRLSKIRR